MGFESSRYEGRMSRRYDNEGVVVPKIRPSFLQNAPAFYSPNVLKVIAPAMFQNTPWFGTPTAINLPGSAPQFDGITSWDWSANSLSSLSDDDPVSSWTDRHSGLSVSQGNASLQPKKTTLSGKNAVLVDGVDDKLTSAWAPDLTGGYTVFCVFQNVASELFEGFFMADQGGSSSSDAVAELYYANAGAAIVSVANRVVSVEFYQSGNVYNTVLPDMATGIHGTDTAVRGLYNGRNRNDATPNTGDGIPSQNPTRIFVCAGNNERSFDGYMFELVIYDAALTETQRDEVWDFLEAEWGGPF